MAHLPPQWYGQPASHFVHPRHHQLRTRFHLPWQRTRLFHPPRRTGRTLFLGLLNPAVRPRDQPGQHAGHSGLVQTPAAHQYHHCDIQSVCDILHPCAALFAAL